MDFLLANLKSNLGVWEKICENEGRWDDNNDDNDEKDDDNDNEDDDDGIPAVLIAVRELDHENDDFSDIEDEEDDEDHRNE